MLTAAWLVGAAVVLGLVLAGYYLAERPILGAARWAGLAHGVLGAAGTAAIVWALASVPDRQGFGRLAAYFLGAALLGGLVVAAAKLRRRRPPGLAIMLHATIGVAGFVMLAAALSVG